jgi:micrococcal nuclease
MKVPPAIVFLTCLLSLVSIRSGSAQSPILSSGTVLSVGDGDGLRVSQGNQIWTLRLACIDAPEPAQQPYGNAATNRLKQLLPVGSTVEINPVDTDQYGRTVALVSHKGQLINLQLVQEGHAVVYRQFLKNCPSQQASLTQAEAQAKAKRLNFWKAAKPVMPWEFRSRKKTPVIAKPQPQFPACVKSDCDCRDFASWEEAQRVFQAYPGDPFRLDGDRDGIACEALRR